jgi:hypothetical protein
MDATSVRCSPPEPGREGLQQVTTARGELDDPVQIVGDQRANPHSVDESMSVPPPSPTQTDLRLQNSRMPAADSSRP